jgi:hypothetical protein
MMALSTALKSMLLKPLNVTAAIVLISGGG